MVLSRILGYLLIVAIWVFAAAATFELGAILLVELRSMPDAVDDESFDRRSRRQVILDFRRASVPAVPSVPRGLLSDLLPTGALDTDRRAADWYYFAGMPKATNVLCNEAGIWETYESDELGFNNPYGAWSRKPIDVAFIGDSHTQGQCVPADKNFAALVRSAGFSVVNLGGAGSGPLSELAVLKEFAPQLRPKDVFWVFYEGNDIANLNDEKGIPHLAAYLDQGYLQGNFTKSAQRVSVLREYIDAELSKPPPTAQTWMDNASYYLREVTKLGRLRRALGLLPYENVDRAMLHATLEQARNSIASWGGRLNFIYLPSVYRYIGLPGMDSYLEHIRTEVSNVVGGLGIPIIDMHEAFSALASPQEYYNMHLSRAGHQQVAEAALLQLNKQGRKE